jgi:hypothetical protein
MKFKLSAWIYNLSRWSIGAVFIYAGVVKLLEPQIFAALIDAYGIVPEGILMPVAVALPAIEIIAGLGLLFDIEKSLSMISGLLLLFIAVLGYGVWMGLDVDCGCFGPEDPESKAFHGLRTTLYRDLVMLVSVAFIYGWRRYRAIKPLQIKLLIKSFRSHCKTPSEA